MVAPAAGILVGVVAVKSTTSYSTKTKALAALRCGLLGRWEHKRSRLLLIVVCIAPFSRT